MGVADGYVATCRREGASWMVEVPALGRRAPSRRLTDAERVAVGLVSAATGRPREAVAVHLELDVPEEVRMLVEAAAAARLEPDHLSPAAITRRRSLARKLLAEDILIADVAFLLGVSVARAHQLAGRSKSGSGGATGPGRGAGRSAATRDARRASRAPEPVPAGGAVPAVATAGADAASGAVGAWSAPSPVVLGPTTAELRVVQPPHSGYQHEAFLHRGDDTFLAGTLPFVRDGVERGQPVLVAVVEPRLKLLRQALGGVTVVEFVDVAKLGGNPARLIPRLRRFVDEHSGEHRPVRGVVEPIWAGRRPEEVVECQLHEALLNVAVDPDTPLWLTCTYDADALAADVLAAAHRSHPTLVGDEAGYRGSTTYGGLHHVDELFRTGLPEPAVIADRLGFRTGALDDVRTLVMRRSAEAGLGASRVSRLAAAVAQVATHSVAAGGGSGVLRVWRESGTLTCEVSDHGYVDDPLVGRHGTDHDDATDRAVRLANEVADLTQVRSTADGTVIRLLTWL